MASYTTLQELLIEKCGYLDLVSRGKGINFRKKRRKLFFELDPFNESVQYFNQNPQSYAKAKLIGSFRLEDYDIKKDDIKGDYRIVLRKKEKKMVLIASSEEERDEWFNAFHSAQNFKTNSEKLLQGLSKEEAEIFSDFIEEVNKEREEHKENSKQFEFEVPEEEIDEIINVNEEAAELQQPDFAEEMKEIKEMLMDAASLEEMNQKLELEIQDINGNTFPIKDIVDPRAPTLIMLLRHYGCSVCRHTVAGLVARSADFYATGVPLIAIAPGTAAMAKDFAKNFDFPGSLYVDTKKQVHSAFKCKRGTKYVLSKEAREKSRSATINGFDQSIKDSLGLDQTKDPLQIGGVFLLSPSKGFVYNHVDRFMGDTPSPDALFKICKDFMNKNPLENWSFLPNTSKDWSKVIAPRPDESMIKLDEERGKGWNVETGRNNVIYSNISQYTVEFQSENVPFYSKCFEDKPHEVYVGDLSGNSLSGDASAPTPELTIAQDPFVLVVHRPTNDERGGYAIMWTQYRSHRFLIPRKYTNSEKASVSFLKSMDESLSKAKIYAAKDLDLTKELAHLEKKFFVNQFKFGLLYAKPGQTEEMDIYENSESSEGFQEFMDLLGNTIELKDWNKFKGGLHHRSDGKGSTSLYTTFNRFEIMFHVNTLLPHTDMDPSRIEKKKHCGNDVVLIIYKEGNEPLDFTSFKSQFNHVFIVVSPTEDKKSYRVNVAYKPDVQPASPYIQSPPIYPKNSDFREFLLSKTINSELEGRMTPMFRMARKARCSNLNDMVCRALFLYKYSEKSHLESKKRASNEDVSGPSSLTSSPRMLSYHSDLKDEVKKPEGWNKGALTSIVSFDTKGAATRTGSFFSPRKPSLPTQTGNNTNNNNLLAPSEEPTKKEKISTSDRSTSYVSVFTLDLNKLEEESKGAANGEEEAISESPRAGFFKN